VGHSGDDWDFSHISELTERQLRSIELTMQGHSDSQIAQRLSINRKTIWRWKTLDADYRRILASARVQLYAAATDRYQVLLARATAILAKSLEDPADQRSFPAALAILNMAGCYTPLPLSYYPPNSPPALPPPPPPPWPNTEQDPYSDPNCPEPDLEPKVG
jgi:hypothetical protein